MSIPDQIHINQVRDALWQRFGSGASVMVGSGFSKNAVKRPDTEDLPMWRDVIEKMTHKLYQQESSRKLATKNPLRIAQEYETAFGPSHLRRFIRQTVRDDDFKPGDAHKQLLRLPWRDVFTTNWDTLLEKAQAYVSQRAYSVVRRMEEIPLANKPRIVKLHGSLPDQFPFVFTEEHYRTYPTKFAPFVNTVQQAMMETVFCVVGFSGDDPNFLQWSGWVRDNLGDAAPPIYLAGWLDLSLHERRLLENRNIFPIDLAHHPKAGEWRKKPRHLRHIFATEWILQALSKGETYNVTEWPIPNTQDAEAVPTHLEPVEVVTFSIPREEPWSISSSSDPETGSASAHETLAIWAHNRKIYPGWLVAPSSVQPELSSKARECEPLILSALPSFEPVERLNAIRELVWRRELLIEPISPQLKDAAKESLNLIDCQNRTIDDTTNSVIDWDTVREAWRHVAIALVTEARYRFDQEEFDQWIKALSPFIQDDPAVGHRICHERCLWAMYAMDFEALNVLLEDWQSEDHNPIWMMRKAAITFDTGQHSQAEELVRNALVAIRTMPADNQSLTGPSLEGWALSSSLEWNNWRELHQRWDELAPLKCDVRSDLRRIGDALSRSGKGAKETPSFDLGVRRLPGLTFSNINPESDAYRAIRLSEVAGIHPTKIWDILALAAEKLMTNHPELATRIVLLACSSDRDKMLQRVLSRTRVAALTTRSAETLSDNCMSVVRHALPRMGRPGPGVFWSKRMGVATEVLSRLVLRLESDRSESILDEALVLYQNRQIAEEFLMTSSVHNLLKRSWEALPEDRRKARVLDLLSAPIVDVDGFKASSKNYPDPGDLLEDGRSNM